MDRRMMNEWLAAQGQKKQVTEASMQRKRLGIKEYVDYGDLTTRVTPLGKFPRSPESAENLSRRLQNLVGVVGDPDRTPLEVERAAKSLVAKGVGGGRGPIEATRTTAGVVDDLIHTIRQEKDIHAGKVPNEIRNYANLDQKAGSQLAGSQRQVARQAELNKLNTIKTGRSKLPKALGVAGAVLGLATGAQAADIVHGLNPLSALDSGSLGTDDMMGEPIEFKEPAPKQQKPLPGAQFMYPAKMNENNMMNQWLKAQTQKQQQSTRSFEQQRQGIAITEQLNVKEEAVAKSHKSMLANMVKQYGEEKGTRVFYAKVRDLAKKK